MERLSTRLTELLRIQHPILLAPMDIVADGRLAAAVSHAGGFGIIGGSYGDEAWLTREMDAAGDARVGVGFITWSMADVRNYSIWCLSDARQQSCCPLAMSSHTRTR
jgi:NAD(P)H-dependent flavin oxidoreductase YrpB (nitropropane dioxygenase family)